MEAANLPSVAKFGNAESYSITVTICVVLAKIKLIGIVAPKQQEVEQNEGVLTRII